jgi:hypothetical protein
MKFIFKKYMDFEKLHGNEVSIEKVKELAANYVEKKENKENNNNTSNIEEHLKKKLLA